MFHSAIVSDVTGELLTDNGGLLNDLSAGMPLLHACTNRAIIPGESDRTLSRITPPVTNEVLPRVQDTPSLVDERIL